MIYDVKKQGAAGDGKTDDTAAIQKGIDACFQNGGGSISPSLRCCSPTGMSRIWTDAFFMLRIRKILL